MAEFLPDSELGPNNAKQSGLPAANTAAEVPDLSQYNSFIAEILLNNPILQAQLKEIDASETELQVQ